MLKTNSKKASENIRNYILDDSEYIKERAEHDGCGLETDDEIIAYAFKCF